MPPSLFNTVANILDTNTENFLMKSLPIAIFYFVYFTPNILKNIVASVNIQLYSLNFNLETFPLL